VQRDPGRPERASPQVDLAIVCYFNPADVLGGAERIAWAEAELLSSSRRVVFLSASPPVVSSPVTQLRVGGWTRSLYQPLGTRRNPFKLAVFHLLSLFNPVVFVESLRLLRRLRPAVVHTHNVVALSPAIWLSARLSGAKVIHTHHDLWLRCERATMTDAEGRPCNDSQRTCRLCRAMRPAKTVQIKLVSAEVFPSRWLRDRLGRRGEVVPSFSTSFAFASDDPPAPVGPARVAFVGALTPHKLGPLLEAFAVAATGGSPMRLDVAGVGPLAPAVSALARSNPDVSYLGQIDSDARDHLLREASVVVIPSTCAENSPLVFFEALAAGVPVIGSDIGGISELAAFGSMVLVPPGDLAALADALTALVGDAGRLAELRTAARRHRGEASPERYAGQMEHVIAAFGTRAASTRDDH
jgi:glycosyltransferase involved in cell wall biosynthesis